MLKVLDLFSGIGGFSLGLERAGFETVAFCEIEPFCRRVLAKHWPEVPCYDDIRTLTADRLAADGVAVDIICGGFPCQDISTSGLGAGLDGERSGLWSEYARLIGNLRPKYVIVENVSALLGRGLGRVLGDLACIRYDAEWEVIRAADVGAPHERNRLWLAAFPHGSGRSGILRNLCWSSPTAPGEWPATPLDSQCSAVAWLKRVSSSISPIRGDDDGLSSKMVERQLGMAGNAVVPQIPEMIGRAILAAEAQRKAA